MSDEASNSPEARLKRLRFRAWHRGTREADYMIGCLFDRFHAEWGEDELLWFEDLLEEEDVDIMAWALGTLDVPERFRGPLMDRMRKLDYVEIPR
ncbi:MAG: succinate dehydrogenase assembly factor 2 [Novosphingobium sp.]